MKQVRVEIDGRRITSWESFHDVFAEALGFPSFYGRNMDAWIDCMTCVDDPEAGMSTVTVERGGIVVLVIEHAKDLRDRCREQYDALIECSAFVNFRRGDAVLALSFPS